MRALKKHFARQRPTLALDSEASGLVVFSQQHGVLRKLVDDGARLEQEYLVEVTGDLAAGGLERLRHGLAYQGRRLSPCKVSWQNESHLRFALKDVLPGQLRFMCESEGLEVRSIRRLRIGALSLARLPLGEWRYLGLHERF